MSTFARLTPAARIPKLQPIFRWLKRLTLGWLAAVIVLGAVGAVYQALAVAADRRAYPAPGQVLEVGGFKMHIACQGTGSPTVILEALAGGFSSYWAWVQPEIAQQVRVCAYDRAGYGWSEADPEPETPARVIHNLHTLLERAGIAGPYVLVGHSKGGLYVRAFTAEYPQDVVGLVLVDASQPDQFDRHPDWLAGDTAMLKWMPIIQGLLRLGVGHAYFAAGGEIDFAGLPPRAHAEVAAALASPEYWASQRASMLAAGDIFHAAQSLGALGNLPLAVVSRGTNLAGGWGDQQDELAALSTNSLHLIIPEATHSSLIFKREQARQVSAAILQVVEAARSGQPLSSN